MRSLLLSAATILFAGAAIAAPSPSASLPQGAAHNIVLVHGAFVDQTSWKPVADILTKKGYNVTLVENPLTSLAADDAGPPNGQAFRQSIDYSTSCFCEVDYRTTPRPPSHEVG
jgi:hypothetical protein